MCPEVTLRLDLGLELGETLNVEPDTVGNKSYSICQMSTSTPEPLALDLRGRVGNTRLAESNGLMAVFEAVANAIQAVDETQDRNPGRIEIHILRNATSGDAQHPGKVNGFRITDHGVGFTDDNYASFKCSDSTRKRALGGRGVGRFTWLRVFRSVRIDSEYEGVTGTRDHRAFLFTLDGLSSTPVKLLGHRGTAITLLDPDPSYSDSLQTTAERLAQLLVDHCLLSLLAPNSPPVYVIDDGISTINLKEHLTEHFLSERKTSEYFIEGVKFTQFHLLLSARKNAVHIIHLCAAKRSVKKKRLSDEFPELTGPLLHPEDSKSVVYAGYVISELLDRRVHQDRDEFWLGQVYANDGTDAPKLVTISQADIEAKACASAATFLEPWLEPYREARRAEINRFVQDEAPQFRYILNKHADRAMAIKAGASKLDIYQHLSRIEFEHDKSVESRVGDALASIDSSKSAAEHSTELEALLAEVSEGAQAKLAKYVLYRRAVINILEKHQALQEDGRYQLEKTVHQTVFPMGRNSDETPFALWNLWLIDERLAFHRFLSSDVPLSEMKQIIKTDERDRPDIAVFKRPMGFTDAQDSPFGSIVLVDFKRPARRQYQADEKHEDPVLQVTDYMRKLLAGEAVKADGSTLRVPQGTPIYAYVIADLTPPLIDLLKGRGFLEVPDKGGYFQYNQPYCAYIEVMGYDKLIQDAKRRNKAFFAALSISAT